jgi:hypothetical protein
MKRGAFLSSVLPGLFFIAIAYATPPSPEGPSPATVEAIVKSYVDKDFIHEELPPPEQCGQYSDKLMFAYDWDVTVHNIKPYDPARQLWLVEALITVRCGPFHSQSHPGEEAKASDFPLRAETPIEFQLSVDPEHAQQWKIQEVTLWKSKQRVIQQ